MSNNTIICCKECTRRKVGCHQRCKEYIQARKEQDLYNKKEREDRIKGRTYTTSKDKNIRVKINKNK